MSCGRIKRQYPDFVCLSSGLRPLPPAPTLGKRAVWWWLCCASWVYWLLVVLGVVVSCEMCGSKLASGGWLLLIFQLQLSLWTRILLFWVSQTYYLVCLLAPFYHPRTILSAWGHPRGPWGQQEGHVRLRNEMFNDFLLIWGFHFDSFLGLDG